MRPLDPEGSVAGVGVLRGCPGRGPGTPGIRPHDRCLQMDRRALQGGLLLWARGVCCQITPNLLREGITRLRLLRNDKNFFTFWDGLSCSGA